MLVNKEKYRLDLVNLYLPSSTDGEAEEWGLFYSANYWSIKSNAWEANQRLSVAKRYVS